MHIHTLIDYVKYVAECTFDFSSSSFLAAGVKTLGVFLFLAGSDVVESRALYMNPVGGCVPSPIRRGGKTFFLI